MYSKIALASIVGLAAALPQNYGPSSATASTGPSSTSNAASSGPTMHPALGPEHDASDLSHLQPTIPNSLYYAEQNVNDTSLDHAFAELGTNTAMPAIVLDHSQYIEDVKCTADGLSVLFSSADAFSFVEKELQALSGPFMVITSATDCAGAISDASQHSFFNVSKITAPDGGLQADLTATEIPVASALLDVDMTWGKYSSASAAGAVASSVASSVMADVPVITSAPSLERRQFGGIIGGIESVGGDITSVGGQGVNAVTSVGGQGVNAVTSVANVVATNVVNGVTEIVSDGKTLYEAAGTLLPDINTPTETGVINIDAKPSATASSPWGSQASLWSQNGIDVYCVDCEFKGKIDVTGSLSFSIANNKLNSGTVGLSGDLSAKVGFGVVSNGAGTGTSKQVNIYDFTPDELSIPHLITIGPQVDWDFQVEVDIEATGNMLANMEADLNGWSVNIDLTDKSKSSYNGKAPTFPTPSFKVSGEVTVHGMLSLPITVGLGIDIPALTAVQSRWEVDVTNTPAIEAQATYTKGKSCVDVESWLSDDTNLNVLNVYSKDLKNFTSPDIYSSCISAPGLANLGSKTSSAATSSATSAKGTGKKTTTVGASTTASSSTATGSASTTGTAKRSVSASVTAATATASSTSLFGINLTPAEKSALGLIL